MRPFSLLPLLILPSCGDPVVMAQYLAVVDISPPGGAIGVAVDVVPSATFSSPLNEASVEGENIFLLDPEGTYLPSTLDLLEDGYTVTLTPDSFLCNASSYMLVLGTGVSSEEAGNLVTDIQSSFTTAE